MRIFLLITLLIFASCSSSSKKEKEDLFADINDSDFDAISENKYNPYQDKFDEKELSNVALGNESLALSKSSVINDLADSDNPLNQAIASCYQKNFDRAHKAFDKLFKAFRKNPSYWNAIGSCYVIENKLTKAILFYNKSRELNDKYIPAINNIGVVYLLQNRPQKAITTFKLASDLSTFSFTPKYNMAQVMLTFGLADKAYELLVPLYKSYPDNADLNFSFAYIQYLKSDYKSALSHFTKMDRDYYKNSKVGFVLAHSLILVGELNRAKDILSEIKVDTHTDVKFFDYLKGKAGL